MGQINELCKAAHQNAISKGFFDEPRNIGEMVALIHSECSEALEADRMDKYATENAKIEVVNGWVSDEDFVKSYKSVIKGTFEEEMADISIRVFDMCGFKNIDLEEHIKAKMRYNSLRPHKHGKKY